MPGSKRLLRHPSRVWLAYLAALFFIFYNTHYPSDFSQENVFYETKEKWALHFIEQNELLRHKSPVSGNIAENNVSAVLPAAASSVRVAKPGAEHRADRKPVSQPLTAIATGPQSSRQEEAVPALTPRRAVLSVYPVSQSVETDYERNLNLVYAMQQAESIRKTTARQESEWLVRAGGGVLASDAVMNQPEDIYSSDNIHANGSQLINSSVNGAFGINLQFGVTLSGSIEMLTGLNYMYNNGTMLAVYDAEGLMTQNVVHFYPQPAPDGNGTVWVSREEEETYTLFADDSVRSDYTIQSFEIPVVFRYHLGQRKLSYFLATGFSATIGSNYKANYYSGTFDNGYYSDSNFGPESVNLLLSGGVRYKAGRNLFLSLFPGLKYGIPIGRNASLKSASSSIGIFTGINYYFR